METAELQKIAQRTRLMREAGVALIIASGLLALFFFIPLEPDKTSAAPTVVATATTTNSFPAVSVVGKAAIVYDLATGKVLYAKNADAQLPLASLTKLLTIYGAFSELSPSTPVTIPDDVADLTPPHAFSPGQVFALSNLARLTLTASLNDGAAAIAEATAAQENQTTSSMLAGVASALNLSQTYAVNGNGLDVSSTLSGGYGSAHDMAILAGALVRTAPQVAAATTQSSTQATDQAGTLFTVHNTDPIVENIPHLLLSKTGYTDLAGGNLALVFDVGIGHPIAIVVLGSTQTARFTDGYALVAATLANFAGVKSL